MESIDANAYLETQELALKIGSFQNIKLQSYPKSQNILAVCDICDKIQKVQIEEYLKQNEIKCDQCEDEGEFKTEIQCRCCRSKFEIKYQTALRNDTIVKLCEYCKKFCRSESNLKKCFYCEIDCSKLFQEKQKIQGYYFCAIATQFLKALRCNKCQGFYDFSFLIEKNNYDKEKYTDRIEILIDELIIQQKEEIWIQKKQLNLYLTFIIGKKFLSIY